MNRLKVLSEADVEHFITRGYVVLRDAFPAHVAAGVRSTREYFLGFSTTLFIVPFLF